MAETGKKAADNSPAVVGPPANQAVDAEAAKAVQNPVPATPDESPRASHKVFTEWPHTNFVVSGDVPAITSTGTMLTKTQLDAAEVAAKASGVPLRVEEVK